jgi:hypothetical protein
LLVAAYFVEVGLLLVVIPWSSFWERNIFFDLSPWLHAFMRNRYLRGGVTGLGIVNLALAIAELADVWRMWTSSARPIPAGGSIHPSGRQ